MGWHNKTPLEALAIIASDVGELLMNVEMIHLQMLLVKNLLILCCVS